MEKIFVKENEVTYQIEITNYNDVKDLLNYISKVFNVKNKEYSKKEIEEISLAIFRIMQTISSKKYKNQIVIKLNEYITNAKSKEDYLEVVNLFIKAFNLILTNKKAQNIEYVDIDLYKTERYKKALVNFNSHVKNDPELVVSMTIKKIISSYYYNLLTSINRDTLYSLMSMKKDNESIDKILSILNIKFPNNCSDEIKKIYKNIFLDVLDEVYDITQIHLCWENCANARADLCPKIMDIEKRNISEYRFITDGYQTYDESGVDKFIVNKCKLYKREQPKNKDPLAIAKLRRDFIFNYYGVNDYKELLLLNDFNSQRRNIALSMKK